MSERPDFVILRAQYDVSSQRTEVERDVLALIAYAESLEAQLAAALEACALIVAVRHCMMFDQVHADFSVREVLEKYDAPDVQTLAMKAQDAAAAAMEAAP